MGVMDHDEPRAGSAAAPRGDGDAQRPAGAPARPPASSMSLISDEAVLLHPSPTAAPDQQPGTAEAMDLLAGAALVGQVALAQDGTFSLGDEGLEAHELSQVLAGIDRMRSALAALEMRTMTALDEHLRAEDAEAQLPAAQQGRRTAGEIRMASRVSPSKASNRLRAGERMVRDMPCSFRSLATGALSVESAYAIGRSAGPVAPELRSAVDEVIDAHLPDLDGISGAQWSREVAALAESLDPRGSRVRHRDAARERSVTVTAGAHGMGTVSAHLPGVDCAAIRRKLSLTAESLQAQGDRRTSSQIMADLFADTLLGRDETMDPVHIELGVVITERTLFSPEHGDPALVEGYGMIDSGAVRDRLKRARSASRRPHTGPRTEVFGAVRAEDVDVPETPEELLRRSALGSASELSSRPPGVGPSDGGPPPDVVPSHGSPPDPGPSTSPPQESRPPDPENVEMADQIRRLYTHPRTGELVAVESRSRAFPAGLARYMRMRDLTCVGPYCGAPIRHIDHIRPHAEGGPTSADNGQGLCAHCNLTKEALGRVEHTPTADGSHRVTWTSRLGRTATVGPSSLTGLPGPSARTAADVQDASDAPALQTVPAASDEAAASNDKAAHEEQQFRASAHRHLELMRDVPRPPERDPLEGMSATERDAMDRAAVETFTPATAIEDESEILEVISRRLRREHRASRSA
jgi:hypothetical protein